MIAARSADKFFSVSNDGDRIQGLDSLADWSPWMPLSDALTVAPRVPGVYLAREGEAGPVVYVGMAGERAGGKRPQGLRGRLAVYLTGKGLISGLGEAIFDRALADPVWLRTRIAEVEAGQPMRAKAWGRAALVRSDLHIRWAATPDKTSALALERTCLDALASDPLWNRLR